LSQQNIPTRILEWPAKGNTYLESLGVEIDDPLAPFVDLNNNGIYEPEWGDYPFFKGHQAQFWVMNDAAGPHSRSGGKPLNVEIHAMAYSFVGSTSNINLTTFYDYTITKKTQGTISDAYFSLFVDPDVGTFIGNEAGCDTILDVAFALSNDPSCWVNNLPNIQFIKMVDNNTNNKMSSFLKIGNVANNTSSEPTFPIEFRNFQLGKRSDGLPYKFGGNGFEIATNIDDDTTKYIFLGNPALCNVIGNWTQNKFEPNDTTCNIIIAAPGDWRFLMTAGSFTLEHNQPNSFSFGTTSLLTFLGNLLNTDSVITPAANEVQDFYDTYAKNGNIFEVEIPNSIIDIQLAEKFLIMPNPTQNNFEVKFGSDYSFISISNVLGNVISLQKHSNNGYSTELLSSGIYYVTLLNENKMKLDMQRLVVVK